MDSSNHTTPQKRCTKCLEYFPATTEYFHKKARGRYGVASWCKKCHSKITTPNAKAWNEKHPERVSVHQKTYHAKNRDALLEQRRLRPAKKQSATYKRNYRVANREKHNEYQRTFYSKNRDLYQEYVRNRRARKRNAPGKHTAADIALHRKTQKNRCWWCGSKLGAVVHIDHRIPLVKGGGNGPENLCIACPTCNLSKGAKMPWEWNGRLL